MFVKTYVDFTDGLAIEPPPGTLAIADYDQAGQMHPGTMAAQEESRSQEDAGAAFDLDSDASQREDLPCSALALVEGQAAQPIVPHPMAPELPFDIPASLHPDLLSDLRLLREAFKPTSLRPDVMQDTWDEIDKKRTVYLPR